MARALEQIMAELNSTYNPQRDAYSAQMGTLDPQMDAEQKGLQAVKEDSFRQITDQANRRGLFYSGLPVAEEQRYTGQQFLPAVANLRAKYASQKFGLQDAILKLTAEQGDKAREINRWEMQQDEERRQFDERLAAQERASRASAAGTGFSPSFDPRANNQNTQNAAGAGGPNWGSLVQQNNPYVFKDLIADANRTYFGGKGSYGQLAGWLEQRIGKIPANSGADLALRNTFLKSEIDPAKATMGTINQATGANPGMGYLGGSRGSSIGNAIRR